MYEIVGLKHVFSTFQETVWSHLKHHMKACEISNNIRMHDIFHKYVVVKLLAMRLVA